jgi:hypothetical protein
MGHFVLLYRIYRTHMSKFLTSIDLGSVNCIKISKNVSELSVYFYTGTSVINTITFSIKCETGGMKFIAVAHGHKSVIAVYENRMEEYRKNMVDDMQVNTFMF